MNYEIVCLKCKGNSKVHISPNDEVGWQQVNSVISARKRFDAQWGWECLCGQNSLMTDQEKRSIRNYAQPEPMEIQQIMKNLEVEPSRDTPEGQIISGFLMKTAV